MELTTTSFLDLVPQPALTINRQGQILCCNQLMLDLLGSPGIEHTRAINVLSFPSLVQAGFSNEIRQALDSGKRADFELPYRTVWGKDLILRISCAPIPGIESLEEDAAIIFYTDVTEDRKINLELAAANKAKTQFLANMSHEVRTPLNGVIGFLSLLERRVQDPEAKEFVDAAKSSAKSLLRLISEVLDVAKIEAGTLVVDKKPFHVRPLLDSTLEHVKPLLLEHPLSVKIEVSRDLPQIQGDSVRYSQVLSNLVSNAIKFTPQGSITIKASITGTRGNELLLTEVIDTGIGIPLENQSLLFQPFTQVDGSHTRRRDGAGLGLSICRSLVHLMQGQIGLESKPKQGSRFWFSIPLHPAVSGAEVVMSRVFRASTQDFSRHVLLACSDPKERERIAEHLSQAGMLVTQMDHANSKERGSELVDLVLIDLQSTELDPYSLAKGLRSQGWHGPIVALTRLDALTNASENQKCREAGITDFLSKPCEPDVLLSRIRHWLLKR